MKTLLNFIDGEYLEPLSKRYIPSFNPSTAEQEWEVPDSGKEDVDKAVHSAQLAFETWSKRSTEERYTIMMKIAEILESKLEEFAVAESKDQGKPLSLSRTVDIPRSIYNFRFFARKVLSMESKCTFGHGDSLNYVQHMPVGVCGLISPWNLPLYLLTWKIAPAIAFGNTCVCKPSEITSLTAFMLCQVLKDAGLPNGVVNIIFGTGPNAGAAVVEHPDIPLISFTGGTSTGEAITKLSAPFCKKLSLELGGKNPAIVFNDAYLERCVEECVRSSFTNQGEVCLCTSRIFVEQELYPRFLDLFVKKVKELKVGNPFDNDTKIGAIASIQHLEKIIGYIKLAKEEGGKIMCGGDQESTSKGYFLSPTVIAADWKLMDPERSSVMQDEIFGPVVTVTAFDSEAQAIKWSNSVRYGLAACVWTENGRRQRRVAEQLKAGNVWVNCWMVRDLSMPFGGMKMSGVGREGGEYSMDFFTEPKTICLYGS